MYNYLSLRYFVEIAHCLNFSHAARKLHISQPGLSQQMTALEKELGHPLLIRSTRHVTLTEEGEYLYRNLLPSFENIDRTLADLREQGSVPQSIIRIAAIPSAASSIVPRLIKQLKEKQPSIEFFLKETTSGQSTELVHNSEYHLAFIRTPIDLKQSLPKPLQWMEFAKEPLQIAVSSGHWAADHSEIHLSELKNETFLHYDPKSSPSLYYLLEHACLNAGFMPKTIGAGPEILTRANLIASGIGITLLPRDMIELLKPYEIRGIDIVGTTMSSSISVVWNMMNVPVILEDALKILTTLKEEQSIYNT